MQPSAKEASRLPVYGLVALLGAAGSFLYLGEPFRSARPSVEDRRAALVEYHEIEARLWQDPFQAIADHLERASHRGEHRIFIDLESFRDQQWNRVANRTEEPILMLPVAMPGSFSANDCEDRRRIRYAVLSALELADFEPRERRRLRVVGFPEWPPPQNGASTTPPAPRLPFDPPSRADSGTGPRTDLLVPFEWFTKKAWNETPTCYVESARSAGVPESRTDCYGTVLVLWVDEETALRADFARDLDALVSNLSPEGDPQDSRVTVRYLGPGSSDALADLTKEPDEDHDLKWLRDLSSRDPAGSEPQRKQEVAASRERPLFRAFSSWATTDLRLLKMGTMDPTGPEPRTVETMVATDAELMRELVKELALRGVLPDRRDRDHVLLVSEWDTLYGRALPLTFAATIHSLQQKDGAHASLEDEERLIGSFEAIRSSENWPLNIHRVIYLRGLDGQVPGRSKADPPPAGSTRADRRDAVESLERPEGPTQLDYVRRQAAALKHEQGERVRAIGILGSDVYDKLLLLQALRRLFPRAIFFTTDLDARMLHPSQTRWARNLVVASSYGLRLAMPDRKHTDDCPFCRRQSRLAPFRESYQTGLHLAALRALETIPPGVKLGELRAPKVYEIGRTRALQLVPADTSKRRGVLWLPAAVLAAALLFLLRRFRVALSDRKGRRRKVGQSAVALTIVSVLVLALSAVVLMRWNEEPFALAEGISVWPTQILRLLAAFLALYFLLRGEAVLRWSCLKLRREYPGLPDPDSVEPGWGRGIVARLRWALVNDWPSAREQDRIDVRRLWSAYLQRSKLGPRLLRVGLLSLGYFLLAFSLFLALGFPAIPYRGMASLAADRVALFLNILTFIFLTFFVIDVSMQTERMIRRLGSSRSRWPDGTRREYSSGPRSGAGSEGESQHASACGESIHEWLDIRFVADRTEHLGSLIMGPFIVLFLMIVSRVSFFDRWDWPLALLLVLGLNSVWVLASAFLLRRAAERARAQSLERLHQDRVRSLCFESDRGTRSVEKLIEEIREIRRGAFAPISEQPAVRAFLVPFGGIGAAMFLEWLATSL